MRTIKVCLLAGVLVALLVWGAILYAELGVGCALYAQNLVSLLPADNQVPGWLRSSNPRTYRANNLWEYIDGAADGYLVYSFQQVVTADYKNGKTQVVIDIYEMNDALNAFGIYSVERMPNYHFVNVGVQGYLEGSALNFWKGKYYVKVVAFEVSERVKEALVALGKAVVKNISGKFSEPRFLRNFPAKNLLANSIKYIAKDVLGHSFLANGFTAEYTIGGKKVTMFLIESPDQDATKKSFDAFKKHLSQSGKIEPITNLGKEAFAGQDSYYGKAIVFYDARVMGGVLSVSDNQVGIKLLREVAAKAKK